jgi:hypothetical protein
MIQRTFQLYVPLLVPHERSGTPVETFGLRAVEEVLQNAEAVLCEAVNGFSILHFVRGRMPIRILFDFSCMMNPTPT